jgi:hypothetical protein
VALNCLLNAGFLFLSLDDSSLLSLSDSMIVTFFFRFSTTGSGLSIGGGAAICYFFFGASSPLFFSIIRFGVVFGPSVNFGGVSRLSNFERVLVVCGRCSFTSLNRGGELFSVFIETKLEACVGLSRVFDTI